MADETLFFPDFPQSTMGLKRGLVLVANRDLIPEIKKGTPIALGFDGTYIRFMDLTWSIGLIEEEINMGHWTITDQVVDLSDPEVARFFIEKVEQRPVKFQ